MEPSLDKKMRDIYREYAVDGNMKKTKITKPFYFIDKSHQDIVDIINSEYPVNLKFNEDLLERIHTRYPILKKSEIGIILKSIFQSMRELLILGKILNFHNLFFDTKLHIFNHNNKLRPALKIKMSTPPSLRSYEK